jgi:hypothetical protein
MVVGEIPRTWPVLKFDFDVDSCLLLNNMRKLHQQTETRAAAMYRMYDVSGQSI